VSTRYTLARGNAPVGTAEMVPDESGEWVPWQQLCDNCRDEHADYDRLRKAFETVVEEVVAQANVCMSHVGIMPRQQDWVRNEMRVYGEGLVRRALASSPQAENRECRYVIHFDDADVAPLVFAGEGAKEAAFETYRRKIVSWNCYLFEEVSPQTIRASSPQVGEKP